MENQGFDLTAGTKSETKSVAALIPVELYWRFKKVQAERKETAQDAIVNAIRLYVDLDKEAIVNE